MNTVEKIFKFCCNCPSCEQAPTDEFWTSTELICKKASAVLVYENNADNYKFEVPVNCNYALEILMDDE